VFLREVLQFPAAELARMLDTSTASVTSVLQRARKTVDEHVPHPSQQGELAALRPDREPDGGRFRLGAVTLLRLRGGRIAELAGFLDPAVRRRFALPDDPR
jgi:ketosteroid isomerase-like protein